MKYINPKELKILLEEQPEAVDLIDIRSVYEYDQWHIPKSVSLPIESLKFIEYKPHKPIGVFYCQSSNRTFDSIEDIKQLEYVEHYILLGGISSWRRVLLPICKKEECKCVESSFP